VVPRVLAVCTAPALDDVELVVAPDGDSAARYVLEEPFDAVYLDLAHPPLDGWVVLATIGAWAERPRLVAQIADRHDVARARLLGADHCVLAGTTMHARALQSAWQPHPATNCRRPTTSGARV
jgi:CheY-like chemotaxis protein